MERILLQYLSSLGDRVSILVMLEVKWKAPSPSVSSASNSVSILVMLEVKWKVKPVDNYYYNQIRFNPCYVGSKMERV